MKVFLYDTTLRDGNQDRKISLSLADKLQIARILDHFGFDYIEGGWPNPSNPTDEEFFQKIKEVKLKHAKIAAFGSTRRPKVLPEKDPLLQALVKSDLRCGDSSSALPPQNDDWVAHPPSLRCVSGGGRIRMHRISPCGGRGNTIKVFTSVRAGSCTCHRHVRT